ncbi:MAG: hypothetical protein ABWK00_05795 [Desulfurococcaceae archaeon]
MDAREASERRWSGFVERAPHIYARPRGALRVGDGMVHGGADLVPELAGGVL